MLITYRLAFQFFTQRFAFSASVILLLCFLELLAMYFEGGAGPQFVASAIVAYSLHRALMFDETSILKSIEEPLRPPAMGRFILVLGAIAVVCIGVAVYAAISIPSTPEGGLDGAQLLTLLVVGIVLNYVLLIVFGTAIPAAAAADQFGFGLTLRRARQTWFRTSVLLLVGPGSYWAVIIALYLWMRSAGLLVGDVTLEDGFTLAGLIDLIITQIIRFFGILLTVIVLCRIYQPVASQDVKDVINSGLN